MTDVSRSLLAACTALTLLLLSSQQHALAVELMKDLSCALMQELRKDSDFCLKVFNTCNTPLISRIKEQDGNEKDSPEMRSGERAEVCSRAPFVFVGHYVSSGP